MNNLSNPNNDLKDLILQTFQEISTSDPNFFLSGRLKILSWKSTKINGALVTKIGNIRYLGLVRKDKNGQEYWKYKPLKKLDLEEVEKKSSITQEQPENSSKLNSLREKYIEYKKNKEITE